MKKRLKGFFQRLARWLNVREMRQHKVKAGVYIIIRLILVSLLTAGILNGKWENVMTCVLTLGLLMLPLFIDRKLSVALPSVLETIVVLFVFAANVMGEARCVLRKDSDMGFIAPYCERLYLCRRWFWTDRYFEQKRAGEIEPLAHVCVPVFVLLFNDSRCCVGVF